MPPLSGAVNFTVPLLLPLLYWSDTEVEAALKDGAKFNVPRYHMPQPWEEGIYGTVWNWDPALLLQCRLALQTISLPPAVVCSAGYCRSVIEHSGNSVCDCQSWSVAGPKSSLGCFCQDLRCNLALNYHFCQISVAKIEQLHLINCFSENPGALYVNDAFIEILSGVFVRTLTVSAWLLGMG